MSVTSVAFLLAALLTVSVVIKVIDACADAGKCTISKPSDGKDKEKVCKDINDYLTCLGDAAEKCGAGSADTITAPARKLLTGAGCSGSGAPVLSFLTMVLGVVVSRFFN
ncbi:uncharacterized protein LOC134271101 [Saccostrea cucullata]|uniref:uncharacterized protein LOC134271101 n=1 Tax=Saccostrea cuccullata TaxID=36930 RepID=UPI002ED04AE6